MGTVVSRLVQAMSHLANVIHVCTEGDRKLSYQYGNALIIPCAQTVVAPGGILNLGEAAVITRTCFELAHGADLLVAHDHHVALCSAAASEHGVKTVFFFHVVSNSGLELEAATKARRVIANSAKTASLVEKIYGIKPEVLYLPPPYTPTSRVKPFRRSSARILTLVRYQHYKDITWAVEAIDRVWRRRGGFRVTLAGKGTDQLANLAYMYPWLEVRGTVTEKEKVELIRGADLFLYPVSMDFYGLSVLEAVALGTPALVSDGAGVSEVLGAGVFRAGDGKSLEELLDQVLGCAPCLEDLLAKQRKGEVFRKTWVDIARELLR